MTLLKAAAEYATARGDGPDAVAAMQALSLPQSRDEAWRYFPLRQVLSRRYAVGAARDVAESSHVDLGAVIDVLRAPLPAALRLGAAEMAHSGPRAEGFGGLIQRLAGAQRVLDVLHSPVLPVRLEREAASTGFSAQRWLIRVAAGTRLILLDELQAGADSWRGDELHLDIGAGASVVLLRCVADAATAVRQSRSRVTLAAGANLQWFGIDVRCGISRHELVVQLQGEHASANVRGGGLLSGKSYSETRLELDHQQPGADTSTLWKLVGTESSRGVFNGRIAIAAGADRSDAQLRTASLLLSEQAEIDVKPELEIYADEVSASHGATVGQLDERALFYLRSRGIGLDDARRMLTEAFLRDLFDAVPEGPPRALIEQALAQALPKLDEIAA